MVSETRASPMPRYAGNQVRKAYNMPLPAWRRKVGFGILILPYVLRKAALDKGDEGWGTVGMYYFCPAYAYIQVYIRSQKWILIHNYQQCYDHQNFFLEQIQRNKRKSLVGNAKLKIMTSFAWTRSFFFFVLKLRSASLFGEALSFCV